MKKHLLFLMCLFAALPAVKAQRTSVAYQDAHVRFTVISQGALRMEWNPEGRFVDDPSFVAVNREYDKVDYMVKDTKSKVEIVTPKFRLTYRKGTGRFDRNNLTIVSGNQLSTRFVWTPGSKQQGNLKGTIRTLDGMDGDMRDGKKVELPDGLIATDGWTCIDDSRGFLFDDSDWAWVKERPAGEGQDWYFLAYGHDYKSALKDFTRFAGKMPLPPRYAFGYWWSRYWAYSDGQLRALVDDFRRYDIPLEVLVIDMDWHYTTPGKGGWTGWTWNEWLFPDHARLLSDLNRQGLKVTLNLHPADGVASYEKAYPAMAQALGMDPAKGETIPWVGSDKRFMKALFDHVLHPMEKEGVDFWWLDWQQFPYDKRIDSLSNTWWINYCFFTDMQRQQNRRPMLYHRWGGVGNHRYQIGFSGDSYITWKSLDYQPYFNSTASNVLYGYWSHDIGGHMHGVVEPEMYVRWLQFGCYAPIMRTHTSKGLGMNKEPWCFGDRYLNIIRQTVLDRYALVPYIYTMARHAYDEGESLCRPMYYDYPEEKQAYLYANQYMFGNRLMIAPITAPADSTGHSHLKVWLPEGTQWYEQSTGSLLEGGQEVDRVFALDEYPVYVKKGSILPLYAHARSLDEPEQPMVITLYPGETGSFALYEDQGNDSRYETQHARTSLSYAVNGNRLSVKVGAREGSYEGMKGSRSWQVQVISSAYPQQVTLNGRPLDFCYDGSQLKLQIALPELPASQMQLVEIVYPEAPFVESNGMVARMKQIRQAMVNLRERMPGLAVTEELGFMEEVSQHINYRPEQLPALLDRFKSGYAILPQLLEEAGVSKDHAALFLNECGWTK